MKQLMLVPVVALTWIVVLAMTLAAGALALALWAVRSGKRRLGRHDLVTKGGSHSPPVWER